MKLIAPTIEIDETATANLISSAIESLQGKENPYLILEANKLTYAQTLWIGSGYELEYQTGSIDQHFKSVSVLSSKQVTDVLVAYLSGNENWANGIEFEIKDIRGFAGRLGYTLGKLVGSLFHAK
jgi:hypothetical protein